MDTFFAVSAPGLEPFTCRELEELGCEASMEPGGVSFKGGLQELYRANLHLRTASRVLARLGNFFHATSFPELEERAARLPWERFLEPGEPVCLRVSCHKSKLYHSGAVERSVVKAITERLGKAAQLVRADEDSEDPPQLVVARLAEDQFTASVDSSGTILHKRGYRQAIAKAPLRETLAAGMVMASGWEAYAPFLDPFCGSGTLPIEAAMIALNIPPGLHRRFAFMKWRNFDAALWRTMVEPYANKGSRRSVPFLSIQASDRDAGAIRMAQANAERAGVADLILFRQQAISSIEPPAEKGWVVTNPPYGKRIGEGKDLRDLYARLGDVLREKCAGWEAAILCSDLALVGQTRLELDTSLKFNNGGIAVRLARGKIEASKQ